MSSKFLQGVFIFVMGISAGIWLVRIFLMPVEIAKNTIQLKESINTIEKGYYTITKINFNKINKEEIIMNDETKKVFEDLENNDLPKNWKKTYEKVKCNLKLGTKIHWYYKDEEKFYKKDGLDIKQNPPYSGIVIPNHNTTETHDDIDYDDCIVIVTHYPVEKCNCVMDWVALKQLLDNENLVEIYSEIN